MSRLLGIACLMSCFLSGLSAQNLRDASEALGLGDPETAIKIIEQISQSDKTLLLHAECRLALHQPLVASELLARLDDKSGSYHYIQAKALHMRHEFATAVASYKKYISTSKLSESAYQEVIQEVTRCLSAVNLQLLRQDALQVIHLGNDINSAYDEVAMYFVAGTPDMLYFSSNRYGLETGMEFFQGKTETYDIMTMKAVAGKWTGPSALDKSINSPLAEFVLASLDDELLLERRGNESSDIFLTSGRLGRSLEASRQEMTLPYDPTQGDVDLHFVSETKIIFSSRRRGGKGGYDLYYALLGSEGWSPAINLGAMINSPYDERYASTDKSSLYFSSDRTSGPGGMDIYHSEMESGTERWTEPKVMPLPVSSASDDIYYRPAGQHFKASLASNRPGGAGGYDLYIIRDKKKSYASSPVIDAPSVSAESLVLQAMRDRSSLPAVKEIEELTDTTSADMVVETLTSDPEKLIEETSATPGTDSDRSTTILSSPVQKDSARDKQVADETARDVNEEIAESTKVDLQSAQRDTASTPDRLQASTQQKREYYLAPLYYRSLKDLGNIENSSIITELIAYLRHDTLAEVSLEAFARKGPTIQADLYFSTRPAMRIATQLTTAGIAEERVHISGYGSAYPAMAYEQPTLDLEDHAKKVNSHVMLRISHLAPSDGPQHYIRVVDAPSLTVPSVYELLQEENSTLHYRVRFLTSSQLNNDPILQSADDLVVTVEGKDYHYHLGIFGTYSDAANKVKELKRMGYSDAQVIGFYGGAELSERRALKAVKFYPELQYYLDQRF